MLMLRLAKKLIICAAFFCAIIFVGFKLSLPYIAGASKFTPRTLNHQLSSNGKNLIEEAFEGIKKPADYHVHLLGTDGSRDTYINPKFTSYLSPYQRARYEVFMHTSKIENLEKSLEEFKLRVLDQAKHMPATKFHIYGFEAYHKDDGTEDLQLSDFYIGNQTVVDIAEKHPQYFVPVISVHPKRKDALKTLKRYHKRGVKYVKWLPNAMNINPDDEDNMPFYKALKEYKMAIIAHVGDEHAVSSQHQDYGNPLIFRRALDAGVTVIMAHAATLGECRDLDAAYDKQVPCFDLFLRLMDQPKYKSNLYGDMSSIYLFNRDLNYVKTLLAREDLHSRFLNGSDYPLIAINYMVHLKKIEKAGLITHQESVGLKEIYLYNPLLFDFVLKRTIRDPKTRAKFKTIVFEERDLF